MHLHNVTGKGDRFASVRTCGAPEKTQAIFITDRIKMDTPLDLEGGSTVIFEKVENINSEAQSNVRMCDFRSQSN